MASSTATEYLPWILYDSIADRTNATLSADLLTSDFGDGDAADAGYPVENAFDRRVTTEWRYTVSAAESPTAAVDLGAGNTEIVDTVCVTGHPLYTLAPWGGSGFYLQSSSNGTTWTNEPHPIAPTEPWLTPQTWALQITGASAARFWRVVFQNTQAGHTIGIGAVGIGRRLMLPEGFGIGFDPSSYRLRSKVRRNEAGQPLGAAIQYVEGRGQMRFGPAGWALSAFENAAPSDPNADRSWEHFLATCWAHGRPFWLNWRANPDLNLLGSVLFCWPSESASYAAPFLSQNRRRVRFDFQFLVEVSRAWEYATP